MNQREKTFGENLKTLWNPTTPIEKQQRTQQIRDISFFIVSTGILVLFKDKIVKVLDQMTSV